MPFSIEPVLSETDPVLRLTGELDLDGASQLREAALKLVTEAPSNLVLDLRDLDFIDSTGVGVLVAIVKRLRAAGFDLILRAPGERVRRVLDLTGLDKVFTIEG